MTLGAQVPYRAGALECTLLPPSCLPQFLFLFLNSGPATSAS